MNSIKITVRDIRGHSGVLGRSIKMKKKFQMMRI